MSQQSEDALERRLRAANPVPSERTLLPSGRTLADLLEATMTTELTDREPPTKPSRWRVLAVAAVVIGALAAGGIYLVSRDGSGGQSKGGTSPKTVLALSLPPATAPGMQSCIQFSVDTLRPMQVAFSGTVTSVAAESATLTVDHWYKGGDTDEVRVTTPDLSVPVALEGGVELVEGQRYLVTATDGVVNICGFTAEWTEDLAATFKEAFES
jgi:hypothetical protein